MRRRRGVLIEQQPLCEEAAFFHARQGEEIAAAEGFDILFQGFEVEAVLHEDKAVVEVGLIHDEDEADVELAVLARPSE